MGLDPTSLACFSVRLRVRARELFSVRLRVSEEELRFAQLAPRAGIEPTPQDLESCILAIELPG
jgi:hypothetical protein